MTDLSEKDAPRRRWSYHNLAAWLLLVAGVLLLLLDAPRLLGGNNYAESYAYACGVIAGQQMTLDRWDEDDDYREVRLRAVRRGLSSMSRQRD